jgi:hypothetical protein
VSHAPSAYREHGEAYLVGFREEADERVQSLKARLELVKKRRAAAKQNKAQP